jgi:hypothetical protein
MGTTYSFVMNTAKDSQGNDIPITGQLNSAGDAITQDVVLNKCSPVVLRQSLSTSVAAGNSSTLEITPTTGYVGIIKTLGVYIPEISGATGSHTILVQIGPSASMGAYWFESLYGVYGENGAGLQIYPSNLTVVTNGCIFDADSPLLFKYINNNNAAQAGARIYYVLYEEVLKAS